MNSPTYMSVERSHMQKAFTLAHRCACNPDILDLERKYFWAIAHEIWKACGEDAAVPERLDADASFVGQMAESEARRG